MTVCRCAEGISFLISFGFFEFLHSPLDFEQVPTTNSLFLQLIPVLATATGDHDARQLVFDRATVHKNYVGRF